MKTREQLEKIKARRVKEKADKITHKVHHEKILLEAADLDDNDPMEAKVKKARQHFHSFIKNKIEHRLTELDTEISNLNNEILKK